MFMPFVGAGWPAGAPWSKVRDIFQEYESDEPTAPEPAEAAIDGVVDVLAHGPAAPSGGSLEQLTNPSSTDTTTRTDAPARRPTSDSEPIATTWHPIMSN